MVTVDNFVVWKIRGDLLDEGAMLGLVVCGGGNLKFKLPQQSRVVYSSLSGYDFSSLTSKEAMTQKVMGLANR